MRIQFITANNFKSLIDFKLDLAKFTALIGLNGAGKSTQLKIIMGEIEPTTGQIIRPNSLRIGYLNQEFDIDESRTVQDELWRAFGDVNNVHEALSKIHHALETATPEQLDSLLEKMDKLQRQFEGMNGYGIEAKIGKVLPDMGFTLEDADRLVSSFSGGWQMRMNLAKVILQEPDLLLLDEPHAGLDATGRTVLAEALRRAPEDGRTVVMVSHELEVARPLATREIRVDGGRVVPKPAAVERP